MRWARPLWILVAALGLFMFVTDAIASWPYLHAVCHAACHSGEPDPASGRALRSIGISADVFAMLSDARDLLFWLIWYGMGLLIIRHRPRDPGPLVAAFFLILFPMNPGNSVAVPAIWQPWVGFFNVLAGIVYIAFGLLMPDGRFVPRWTRWVGLAFVLVTVWSALFPDLPATNSLGSALVQVVFPAVVIILVLWAQVYRYRTVSSWEQRQQMKWVLYGVGVSFAGIVVLNIGYAFAPGGTTRGSLYDLSAYWLYPLVNTAIPISIAVAMLRSRLWDVDRVINRTLVYGSLTVSSAALYLGGVVGLQGLAQAVTGQTSDLAIAVVTLVVAALFNPWRRRLQTFIDRRFYRQRYDAARTLAAMSTRLRDDVDLDRLAADLTAVVQETIQPAHVSLWLPQETVQ